MGGWINGAVITVALAVGVRSVAALADVDVLVPERGGGDPVSLGFAPIVVVTLGAFLLAIIAVLVLDRVLGDRSRRVVRWLGVLLLAASFVLVVLPDLPTDSMLVLAVLHVLVGVAVLRTVVRG